MSQQQFAHDEARAGEFMQRLTVSILAAVDGEEAETMADIEQDMDMTKEEAVSILERRIRPS